MVFIFIVILSIIFIVLVLNWMCHLINEKKKKKKTIFPCLAD